MTDIELRNENGTIVGYDMETGQKVPVRYETLDVADGHVGDAIFVGAGADLVAEVNAAPQGSTIVLGANEWNTDETLHPADYVTIISSSAAVTHTGTGPVLEYGDYLTVWGRLAIDAGGRHGIVRGDDVPRDLTLHGVTVQNADTAIELPYRRFSVNLVAATHSNVGLHAYKSSTTGDQTRFGTVQNTSITNNDIGLLSDGLRQCQIWARYRSNGRAAISLRGDTLSHCEFGGMIGMTEGPAILVEAGDNGAVDRGNVSLRNLSISNTNVTSAPTDLSTPVANIHVADYTNYLKVSILSGQYANGDGGAAPFIRDHAGVNDCIVDVSGGRGPSADFERVWANISPGGSWTGDLSNCLGARRENVRIGGPPRFYVEDDNGVRAYPTETDVLAIRNPQQGWTGVHGGQGTDNTAGPAYYTGSEWVSVIDGTTIS